MKSHKLSEETVKAMGLDKASEEAKKEKTIVKEWSNAKEYWAAWQKEHDEEHEKLITKIKDFFVYTIGMNVSDWWYNFTWYFKNLKTFHKVLKEWRPWSHECVTNLFTFGLEQLALQLENHGHEIEVSRNKKIIAMRELIKEAKRDYESELSEKYGMCGSLTDSCTKVTEYSDGSVSFEYPDDEAKKKKWQKYIKALKKERKAHYDKIFKLIVGQDYADIKEEIDKRISESGITDEEEISKMRTELYYELYDGSGYEDWWD